MSSAPAAGDAAAGVEPPAKRLKAGAAGRGGKAASGKADKSRGSALTVNEIASDRLTKIAQENWSSTTAKDGDKEQPSFSPELVVKLYNEELGGQSDDPPANRRTVLLEISQYLERYLWPNFDEATATTEHVMSIILMVNEKFREGVPAWTCFHTREDAFPGLFKRIMQVADARPLRTHEATSHLLFTIHAFQSLEDEAVRGQVLRLVSLPLWHALGRGRLQLELHAHPQLAKHWKHQAKKEAKAASKAGHVPVKNRPEAAFLPSVLDRFLLAMEAAAPAAAEEGGAAPALEKRSLLQCERFVEFMVDLLSQLPTRRFVRTLLDDRAILVKCRLSRLYRHPGATLFRQLVDMFQFYITFPMDDHTGDPLAEDTTVAAHYERVTQLQRLLFKHWPQLRELALTNCSVVERRDTLKQHLAELSEEELQVLVTKQLRLVSEEDPWATDSNFLMEVVVAAYERRVFQREVVNAMPLYPTETILWDENQVPSTNYTGESALALPKLNLQFLTPHDYLLRNFHLFRLEATYEIREDVADALQRVGAFVDDDDQVKFAGWARMACPISRFKIIEVRNPKVGELKPAAVSAEVVVNTAPFRGDVRGEWDELKQHDVLFLVTVRPPSGIAAAAAAQAGRAPSVAEKYGLAYVRGCEVIEVKDEGGKLMNDFTGRVRYEDRKPPEGLVRTVVVALDTAQYQIDLNTMEAAKKAAGPHGQAPEDPYGTFNLVLRRKPKENNFKAVLESIRDIMNEDIIIPEWLHDIFLGYGDPAAAQWFNLPPAQHLATIDFKDTFLDADHVRASFPQYSVRFTGTPATTAAPTPAASAPAASAPAATTTTTTEASDAASNGNGNAESTSGKDASAAADAPAAEAAAAAPAPAPAGPRPPYRITFPAATPETALTTASASRGGGDGGTAADGGGAATAAANGSNGVAEGGAKDKPELVVEAYVPPNPGPYPQDQPRRNSVRFTPVQVDAIRSGVQPGLTMVVGPPGTGKTDTAVQIMHVLYSNCPGQRTLLITHSNQALNDLFQKCMERDIPARYLLRLGMGEADLDTDLDFSRVGRVNAMLSRRLELLAEVEKMAKQLGATEDLAYTCETAAHFWLLHVLSRWEKFSSQVSQRKDAECVKELFPFQEYFADAPQPLFKCQDFEEDMELARGCFRHLRTMFQELEECRAFELLKGQADRVGYLVTRQAKIVAMTCTHAALKRREFLELGLKYDNLVMEESAQVLEVETFIPMVLQRAQDGVARLKRVILIGDHQQLPPVVKNMAFQKYSHLDQSLFTRFIRLGTPYIQLNAQGRARPSLAKLYNWRYRDLGDLPAVQSQPEYQRANPGLAYEYQLINVPDHNGVGESEPIPHFFQNLAEAEYLVSLYQFMRLMGYPAQRISVLTTYNGQKALLRDVFERRCANHPLFGRPYKITTVDKYQGQQNDYILLSLVRTRIVGHLRDVRRLVVAMSRARLGLYIFGRKQLFANCYELQPTFKQLLALPSKLALVKGEDFVHCKRKAGQAVEHQLISGLEEMAALAAKVAREQAAA